MINKAVTFNNSPRVSNYDTESFPDDVLHEAHRRESDSEDMDDIEVARGYRQKVIRYKTFKTLTKCEKLTRILKTTMFIIIAGVASIGIYTAATYGFSYLSKSIADEVVAQEEERHHLTDIHTPIPELKILVPPVRKEDIIDNNDGVDDSDAEDVSPDRTPQDTADDLPPAPSTAPSRPVSTPVQLPLQPRPPKRRPNVIAGIMKKHHPKK